MSRISTLAAIIISALIGALVGGGLAYETLGKSLESEINSRLAVFDKPAHAASVEGDNQVQLGRDQENSVTYTAALDPAEQAVTNVYNKLSPSVVHVSTIQYFRNFLFEIVPQEGTGTGFIISEDGYILTNNHVVTGAQDIIVRLSDGEEYKADLIGTDQMTDLAVLHIPDADIPSEWVAPFGDSDLLQVGQRAIAIGNPFGLDSTITVGVISALDRPLSTQETNFENMIQTDASINPGNSGGPLIDSSGYVIGINTVIFSQSGGSHGVGFAIPINSAKNVAENLIQFGRVRRPSLGFNGFTLYPNLARETGLSIGYGILVQEVERGSAAEKAGLLGGTNLRTFGRFRQYRFYDDGDIIIALDGEKVDELSRFSEQIRKMEIGTVVILTVMRGGERIDLTMELTE